MEQQELLTAAMDRLTLPALRTDAPVVVIAFGSRGETDDVFDVLREFFPLTYVSKSVVGDLTSALVAELCRHLADEGVCPFLEVGDVHHSHFSDIADTNIPAYLIWIADENGQISRSGKDRMEWLMSALRKNEFFLVDPSQDLYPQIFSLPFLPGERR